MVQNLLQAMTDDITEYIYYLAASFNLTPRLLGNDESLRQTNV
jgi:hypothetical protein